MQCFELPYFGAVSVSSYGYTEDEKHYLDELDNRLRSLRPEIDSSLDAPTNSATMEGASHAVATQGSAKEGQRTAQPNYLVLQVSVNWLSFYLYGVQYKIVLFL